MCTTSIRYYGKGAGQGSGGASESREERRELCGENTGIRGVRITVMETSHEETGVERVPLALTRIQRTWLDKFSDFNY